MCKNEGTCAIVIEREFDEREKGWEFNELRIGRGMYDRDGFWGRGWLLLGGLKRSVLDCLFNFSYLLVSLLICIFFGILIALFVKIYFRQRTFNIGI